MTNGDRIRSMSDKALAEYLFCRGNCQEYCYGICAIQDECNHDYPDDDYCIRQITKWLQAERPKAKWKYCPVSADWKCSECDYNSMEHGRYCPNCGVEMVRKEE